MLTVFAVPAFTDNYIWLLDDGQHVVVVDPGQAAPVIHALEEQGRVLSAILLTHHHADHVGGVAALLAWAPGGEHIPVFGPASEKIATVTHPLHDGDDVTLAKPALRLSVIEVPGHTAGHIAYVLPAPAPEAGADAGADNLPRLFCGDTLFATGCGRLFEGTPEQMLHSLDRLAALPPETLVHCAHEYTESNIRFALAADPENADLLAWRDTAAALRAKGRPTLPTSLALEHRCNPFLRADAPGILATLSARSGAAPASRLAAFTALRRWKDQF